MDYREILRTLCGSYKSILGKNFVGFYVHGSIAFGCFHPECSDIDYVCVVREEPSLEEKVALLWETVRMSAFAPKKGLEMHVLRWIDCLMPQHPVYFCLHYSNLHATHFAENPMEFAERMHGRDPDLAAHLTVLREVGMRLEGPAVNEVFGVVPRQAYLESVLEDVFSDSGDAVYTLCNLCRVWAYLVKGNICSKRTGALWALEQEGAPKMAVERALACYESGSIWPKEEDAWTAINVLRKKIQENVRLSH